MNDTNIHHPAAQMAASPAHHPVEEGVAEICTHLLGCAHFGPNDTLLSVGGESLIAGQIVARIQERFGVEIPIRTVLVSTVAQIAAEVEGKLQNR